MRFAFQVCLDVVSIPLEALAISAMLRGAWRRFFVAFAYLLALFVISLMETAFHVLVNFEPRYREAYAAFFWPANTVLISLLFAAVISLIYQATETAPTRRLLRFLVIATAVLIPAVTFAIQYTGKGPHGKWLTPWTSNLDFCAAILDLALWMIAIGSKKADRLVLRLSGALGIQFAGEAIGYSIRALATPSHSLPLVWVGNTVLLFASLPCLYFWWQAFRSPAPSARRTAV